MAGGSIAELRPFLNLATEEDFLLIIAWLLAALRPTGPFPVLAIAGEPGSAKSTLARLLRSIFDPNVSSLRSTPREERDCWIGELEAELRVQDQKGNTPMTQELRDEEWERLAPAARQAVEAVINEAASTEAHATRAFENGDVYAYPHANGIAWGINGGEHGFNIARGTRGRVAGIAAGGPAEAPAMGDPQNGWNGGPPLHGAEKDYLDALRASRGDEAAFHHVFSKLEGDSAVDAPVAAAIACAFTGEAEAWGSRSEALGAIETKFYEQTRALEVQAEQGRTVHFGTGGR